MALQQTQQLKNITVPVDRADQLFQLSKLSVEALNILAEKSKKPGIELRLKTFKNLI